MDNSHELFALANMVLCLAAVGMCLCRLNSMTPNVFYRVRSKYAVILTAALASALQPWWGEWPEWGSLAMALSLVFSLVMGKPIWDHGPPGSAYNDDKEDAPCAKS